ncbi:SHOCT domain-containing protein [Cellulosimicrobium cellulans]|nr:SHOCT domain-containing protein [Cellulosimicrobium cellulans]
MTKKQGPEFEALRAAVEAAIAAHHAPSAPAAPASGAEEVARLADLHQRGILSDEEFTAAKARALGL